MSQYQGELPSFSMLDVMRGMGRRKLLVLASLVLGLLAGVAVVTLIKPKYQSEAQVLIDNLATPYDTANVNATVGRETLIDERTIASQVAVLQSADLGKRVVNSLSLSDRPEFDSMKNGLGLVKQLLITAGFSDDPRLMTPEQRAYEQLNGALTVYPIPLSNVIGIKYSSGNPETAAAVANALAETYAMSTREARTGDTDRAREWLSGQIDALRSKVATSDAAVERFRAEAGLLKGESSTLSEQEISELNTQIGVAEAARTEAEARANEIRNLLETQGSVEASSEVLNSSIVQRLREQQVAVERKYTELSATYLPNHPKMIAAQKEANNIDRQIRREMLKVVDGLQGQAKIAAARANSLRKSLETMKGEAGGLLQQQVKLQELERDAKASRDQLEFMLARFADSNTRQNLDLQPGFARVIQTATPAASPYFPRVGPIVLLAALAGLAFGGGLAFLLEIMAQATRMNEVAMSGMEVAQRGRHPARSAIDNHVNIPKLDVQGPAAVEAAPPAMPVAPVQASPVAPAVTAPITLASIPQARSGLEATALLAALSAGGTQHNTLGQLAMHLQAMRGRGLFKACAIASLGASQEVPALALALGRHLANNGVKTVLVDLEGHRALLPDLIGLPYAPGLTDLLTGTSDFSRAIQRDAASELQFIRHGRFELAAEAQLQQRMEAITKTLTGIYDVVLLNAGEASPTMLNTVRGCSTVLLNVPLNRKKDGVAAAASLKAKGFDHVFLVQVEGLQQAAA